jgi:hypothetical protein
MAISSDQITSCIKIAYRENKEIGAKFEGAEKEEVFKVTSVNFDENGGVGSYHTARTPEDKTDRPLTDAISIRVVD